MKKPYLLLVIVYAVLFYGCGKNSYSKVEANYIYQLQNLHDYTANVGESTDVRVAVALDDQQNSGRTLTITPGNLPTGITFYPTSVNGRNADSFIFHFTVAASVPTGTYKVALNCTSPGTLSTSSFFNIIVQPNCGTSLESEWHVYDSASVTLVPNSYTCYVSAIGTNTVQISLNERNLTCYLNCINGTITSDPDMYSTITTSAGTGTFTSNKIVLRYTAYIDGLPPLAMTSILTR